MIRIKQNLDQNLHNPIKLKTRNWTIVIDIENSNTIIHIDIVNIMFP